MANYAPSSSWPIKWVKGKCKYVNRKHISFRILWQLLFLPYLSSFPRYLQSEYAWSWPWPLKWVAVMLIEDQYINYYLMARVMFFLPVTIFKDIHCLNVHDLDIDLCNDSRSYVTMRFESLCTTSHLMTVVTYAISAIVC